MEVTTGESAVTGCETAAVAEPVVDWAGGQAAEGTDLPDLEPAAEHRLAAASTERSTECIATLF